MIRRCIDLFVAVLALALLGPLLLALAYFIRLDSDGPAFFGGWRIGKDGRPFRMWKFRTMAVHSEGVGPQITSRSDSRVTRFGRVLRRTKLDELPQFFNVLRGDMTLVGPRPEAPEFVRLYTERQQAVLRCRPGITGSSQLRAGSEEDKIPTAGDPQEYYIRYLLPEKVEHDLEYLRSRSAKGDLQIVLATAGYVFRSLLVR